MALSGKAMAQKIVQDILDPNASAAAKANTTNFWTIVCNDICEHIVNNMEVLAGIPVATSGSATAQTGTTTDVGSVR